MQSIAQYAIPVYAVLMLLGGIMGFVKGKSKASLIAGAGSAIGLFGCFAFSYGNLQTALIAAAVLALSLEGMFAKRLLKTKKFMPSGMLLIMSGIFQIVFILGLFMH